MKRTHSNSSSVLSEIPRLNKTDAYKSVLPGTYTLRVKNVYDISKPRDKPIDAIDETDEEETAKADQLNKNNARMLLLELKDSNGSDIRAIETDRIDILTDIKPNYLINIAGPVEIRCGNMMLEKKHVLNIEPRPEEDDKPQKSNQPVPRDILQQDLSDTSSFSEEIEISQHLLKPGPKYPVQVIELEDDWDEEDIDDCIVLD